MVAALPLSTSSCTVVVAEFSVPSVGIPNTQSSVFAGPLTTTLQVAVLPFAVLVVMVVIPFFRPVTLPVPSTVATAVLEEV